MSKFINPKIQAINLVRHIGDIVSQTGSPIDNFSIGPEEIGASSQDFLNGLIEELIDKGLIKVATIDGGYSGKKYFLSTNLTLEGWEQYEEDKKGEIVGDYGFLAMQFGDEILDEFVKVVLKPTVEDELNYSIVDMRDISEAGIIDNIMRDQIRRSTFVIADLTHDNRGAYWEAGYAEG